MPESSDATKGREIERGLWQRVLESRNDYDAATAQLREIMTEEGHERVARSNRLWQAQLGESEARRAHAQALRTYVNWVVRGMEPKE